MSSQTEAHPTCRFYVEIGGVTQAVFAEVDGLSAEVEVLEVAEGGNNGFVHRLPGRCKTGTLTLKRGLTRKNELARWQFRVAQGTVERQNLAVVLYQADGTELMRWTFFDAYPIRWAGPHLKADDAAVAIETLELAHGGMQLE